MAKEIGWDVFMFGMKAPFDKVRLSNMENFYPIEELLPAAVTYLTVRVLGLEFHYVPTNDSEVFNQTAVEFPYVKIKLNFNAKPLNVNDDEKMKLFYKVNLLKTMQYKYIYLGHNNPSDYPIKNPIPDGYAMLISNENDWQIDFDYTNANRKMRNSFISYFPIHTHSITV